MELEMAEFFSMVEQHTAIVASFCTILSTIFVGVGYLSGKIGIKAKRRNVRKCLSLQKKECKIVLPTYGQKLYENKTDVPMCDFGDIKAAGNIIDLIRKTGLNQSQEKIFYEEDYSVSIASYNMFYMGGILANKNTLDIFDNKFPDFKLLITDTPHNNPNNVPPKWFKHNDKNGFFWGNPSVDNVSKNIEKKFEVTGNERFAIIVKLSKEDFGGDDHGDVYILFGQGRTATLAISRYLLSNYYDLYKKVKKKKHFFVAFKVSAVSGEIDGSTFLDLTDVMFDKEKK